MGTVPTHSMVEMRNKAILIFLLLLFFSCCFENCPPTKPEDEPEEEVIEYGDIDAHYFRVQADNVEGSDTVRIFVSWMLFQGQLMEKIEEDHFQLDLKYVPNNFDSRGDYENVHFIMIMDAKIANAVTERVILNGTELKKLDDEILNSSMLYFWFDGKKVYIE